MAGRAMLRTLDANDEMSNARTISSYHVMPCGLGAGQGQSKMPGFDRVPVNEQGTLRASRRDATHTSKKQ